MKALLLAIVFTITAQADSIIWKKDHEQAIETNTLALADKLPLQTAIIGRTGLTDTGVAAVITAEGHFLAPYLPSIDGEDAPYLLYKPDGTRLPLTTILEKPKRFLALLKLEEKDESLLPSRISKVVDHTVAIPTCAPIASLGETAGLFIEHLEFTPPDKATAIRLDSTFHRPGTPVFDLSGSLVAITLKPRATNTPALFVTQLMVEFRELDELFPDLSESQLPALPLAPSVEPDEAKEIIQSELTQARERFAYQKLPSDLPCVLISNQGSQATHSILGTIVREDGMILTKASELGPDLRVRYQGKNYRGILLGTDEKTDLALIGIDASGLPTVTWTDELPKPGTTLSSPILLQEASEDMLAEPTAYLGTYSHLLKEKTPTVHATSQVTSLGLVTEQQDNGISIAAVQTDSPAAKAELTPRDLITKIDGTALSQRSELTAILNEHRVGDEVTLSIQRDDAALEVKVTLISPHLIPPATGIIIPNISMIPSVRRGPFPDVLVHTIPLNAWDCGSPIFDQEGRALGLNISASSPTRSLALRPVDIRATLAKLLAETNPF